MGGAGLSHLGTGDREIYAYDNARNRIAVTDGNNNTTRFAYDARKRLTVTTYADGTTKTNAYDGPGNLASVTHFNGVTTTYTYDQLNRLTQRATPGEATVSFTYTATGKRQTMTDASGVTNYTYDSMDRLISKATPEGTLNYTYDAAGHVASVTSSNPNGISVSYSYDDLNRLSTVVDNRLLGNNTTIYTYDSVNNLVTAKYPNGLQTTFTYDQENRLTELSTPVSDYKYTLGPTGNRISAVESTGRTINWSYDGIYRLTNETINDDPEKESGSVSYGLDPVGNRLSETSSLNGVNSGSFGYNADDEILSETYDAGGNTLTTGGKSFNYDSLFMPSGWTREYTITTVPSLCCTQRGKAIVTSKVLVATVVTITRLGTRRRTLQIMRSPKSQLSPLPLHFVRELPKGRSEKTTNTARVRPGRRALSISVALGKAASLRGISQELICLHLVSYSF